MPVLDILVAGAGIAGPVVAYFLSRAGHKVTIVERDASLRSIGQSIDIREAGVDVMRLMGLEAAIRARCTDEAGLAFVDAADKVCAAFGATGDTANQGFTSEFEILRGDLALVLYEATKDLPGVRYVFDETITALTQDADAQDGGVSVAFASAPSERQQFDLVVGADGLGSRTRGLAFGTTTREHIWSLDVYAAYFTADVRMIGPDRYARWYNAPGRRYILARPDKDDACTRVVLMTIHDGSEAAQERWANSFRRGAEGIRAIMGEAFEGAGWQSGALVEAMARTDDLYGSEVAQIRLPRLATGSVALVGDAGYCPTPLTGMGTSLAIIGAYVLAGEVASGAASKDGPGGGVRAALDRYEEIFHPYARKVQNIPRWLPKLANPATSWGISVQHFVLGWISWLRLDRGAAWLMKVLPGGQGKGFVLPQYDWEELRVS